MPSFRRLFSAALLGAACFPHAPAHSAPPPRVPHVKFSDYRLANGLRVLLSTDHYAPVTAVSVTYNVGSRDEKQGHTGFAHLFEHMMFQGSGGVGKGEHMMLLEQVGGTLNGTTNSDRTNYFEEVPSNQLELALFLEADRMRSLDISQANLDNQRAVVQEEKRQRYDNQPYGGMPDTINALAYSSFGYSHSTIGSMDDLNAASLADVRSFFGTYYAPNNAALAVVGDFDEATGRRLVEKYFGSIPRQPDPPAPDVTEQPLSGEQRKTVQDRLARLTRFRIAYKTVPGDSQDAPPLQLLASILGSGKMSRLNQALVEKRLALNINSGHFPGRGPGLFSIAGALPPGTGFEPVAQAVDQIVQDIRQHGVTEAELSRAKTQAVSQTLLGGRGALQSVLGHANMLTQFAIFFNDPNRINTMLPGLERVTASDILRVANRYLNKDNRVVVVYEPATDTVQELP